MSLPDPEHLLEQAKKLAALPAEGQPRQADLRRAISAAYYALFHTVLTAAADYAIGADKRANKQYALAYRSINHGPLKGLCTELREQSVPNKYKEHFPQGLGQELALFAATIKELQEKRHRADYDPHHVVIPTDADFVIRQAEAACTSFRSAPEEQRNAFLALLLFPPRP